jgi:hypothetical protein
MEFGYTIPASLTRKINIEKLRLYASGLNLLTLSAIKMIDPELDSGQSYPLPRVLNLGVTLTF